MHVLSHSHTCTHMQHSDMSTELVIVAVGQLFFPRRHLNVNVTYRTPFTLSMRVSVLHCVCVHVEAKLQGCDHAQINRVWMHTCWLLPGVAPLALQTVQHHHRLPMASHSVSVRQAVYHREVCDCVGEWIMCGLAYSLMTYFMFAQLCYNCLIVCKWVSSLVLAVSVESDN